MAEMLNVNSFSVLLDGMASPLLVVPLVCITALYGGFYAYKRAFPERARADSRKRVRTRQEEFKLATSLFDTQGNIVAPWQPQPASVLEHHAKEQREGRQQSELKEGTGAAKERVPEGYDGWFNLCLVLLLMYIVTNALHNRLSTGYWMIDKGAFADEVLMWFPELARDWCILGAVYCVFTFGFTLLTLPSPLSATRSSAPLISSPFVSSVAFWISELLFLAGCVYYAQYKSEWPITQRAAWLLESVVLLMKMHSYITVNRQLKMEVDAGGPGTGAIIFHLQHADFIQFKGKTKEAANAHARSAEASADKQQANGNGKASPRAAAGPRLRGARKRSTSRAAKEAPPEQTEKPVVAVERNGNTQQLLTSPSVPAGWSLWSLWNSLLRGLRKDFGTQELDSAAESGQNSAAVYPISKYFTFLGMDSQATPGREGDASNRPAWASRTFWAHRAEAARNLIGKVVYGVNYEGQMTTTGIVAFPNNVNLKDFILFSFAPVLCYEPNYPRTQSIRLWYLAEKMFLAAGLVVAGVYMHSHYVLPVIAKIHEMDEVTAAVQLLGPLTALMLVSFFVIFECILNAFAEFTRFGDRAFYEDWWNATTFLEWNRKWNRPVHTFLLRHIYLDVMRQYGASASTALYATFLVSIVLHEVVVWGITGRSMPWLGLFSLLQFPLGSIQRIRWIKGKRLGNMILWIGLTVGITLITVLYSKNYCQRNPGSCQ